MDNQHLWVITIVAAACGVSAALANEVGEGGTRVLRSPALSEAHVAFVYANDVWIAPRQGGDARRLTSFQGAETQPHFSPDGRLVAFSGEYDGNTDIYVVPVAGGEPRRLTWHPAPDLVRGWTPDSRRVLFASGRSAVPRSYLFHFWTIDVDRV